VLTKRYTDNSDRMSGNGLLFQEWQQSTLTHVSIVHDLVDLQHNQYQQVLPPYLRLLLDTYS